MNDWIADMCWRCASVIVTATCVFLAVWAVITGNGPWWCAYFAGWAVVNVYIYRCAWALDQEAKEMRRHRD